MGAALTGHICAIFMQLCANALYGFTGASVNSLFSRELGDSILALGKDYFLQVSNFVTTKYPHLKVRSDSVWFCVVLTDSWADVSVFSCGLHHLVCVR